ncbi:hypothetical protein G6F50_014996 [Rhizopus delemar]|uniref:Uncharacterized protein n=1 Tax=Rhizopus delemar TaxID=936053 RepID=A0A9P7C612_9FUNG|nr:hypothetical protein G6F50_014996 [Rhizopus delemar]
MHAKRRKGQFRQPVVKRRLVEVRHAVQQGHGVRSAAQHVPRHPRVAAFVRQGQGADPRQQRQPQANGQQQSPRPRIPFGTRGGQGAAGHGQPVALPARAALPWRRRTTYSGRPFTSSKMRATYSPTTPSEIRLTPAKKSTAVTIVVQPETALPDIRYSPTR